MRRTRFTLPAVAVAFVLLSCDAPSRAVAPTLAPNARPSADLGIPGDVSDPLRALVAQLFAQNPSADVALANYDAAHQTAGDPAACGPTAELMRLTLDSYRGGRLNGTTGDPQFAPYVERLVVGLNAYCASVAPSSLPPGALSTNGAAVYVRQTGGTVQTIDGLAGVSLPNGALSQGVLVTITRILPPGPTTNVLGTSLGSGPFYDISTYPHVTLGKPATVGLVQVGPGAALKTVDVVIGHYGTHGTETLQTVGSCPVPSRFVGRYIGPSYLRPSTLPLFSAGVRLADGALQSLGVINDSSGTSGGCGSGSRDFSPFGFIEVYRQGFDAKPYLSASYVCGTSFTISNSYSGDLVAVWRAIGKSANGVSTLSDPQTVFVRAGSSVTVDIGANAGPGSELRLQYGPVIVGTNVLPAVQRSCGLAG